MDNPYFYVFCGFHHFSYNEDNSKNDKEMERMTMSNLQTPFRYDFVGSFLRPEKLKKARRQFNEGKIDAAALKKVEDEAITELVSKIKELGYHVITDGEFRRATWHLDFMWGFDGIGHTPTKTGLPFHGEAAWWMIPIL